MRIGIGSKVIHRATGRCGVAISGEGAWCVVLWDDGQTQQDVTVCRLRAI